MKAAERMVLGEDQAEGSGKLLLIWVHIETTRLSIPKLDSCELPPKDRQELLNKLNLEL